MAFSAIASLSVFAAAPLPVLSIEQADIDVATGTNITLPLALTHRESVTTNLPSQLINPATRGPNELERSFQGSLFIPRNLLVPVSGVGNSVNRIEVELGGNASFAVDGSFSASTNQGIGRSLGNLAMGGSARVYRDNDLNGHMVYRMSVMQSLLDITELDFEEDLGIAVPIHVLATNFNAPITLTIRFYTGVNRNDLVTTRNVTLPVATGQVNALTAPVRGAGQGMPTANLTATTGRVTYTLMETQPGALTNPAFNGDPENGGRGLRGITVTIGNTSGMGPFEFNRAAINNTDPDVGGLFITLGGTSITVYQTHDAALNALGGAITYDGGRQPMDDVGIVRNLLPMSTSVNQPSYAFFSHENTRLNIVVGNSLAINARSRALIIGNVRFQQRDVVNPTAQSEIPLVFGSDIMGGGNLLNNIGGAATASIAAATFTGHSVSIVQMGGTGAAGVPTHDDNTIQAGRVDCDLPAETAATFEQSSRRLTVVPQDIVINTAGVRIQQPVAVGTDTLNPLAGEVTYTLVDAQGNPLDGVAIRALWLGTGPNNMGLSAHNLDTGVTQGLFVNRPGTQSPTAITGNNTVTAVQGTAIFGVNHVSVRGLSTLGMHRNLNARFALTADINFSGPVFVEVTGSALGTSGRVQIAQVRAGVTAKVETTVVPVGFSTVVLADIVIAETEPGDIKQGVIVVSLDPVHGAGQLTFAPMTANQLRNAITVTGDTNTFMNPTVDSSWGITAVQTGFGINEFYLPIEARWANGEVASTIVLSGIRINTLIGTVPAGRYGITVGGSAVTNVEDVVLNRTWDGVRFNNVTNALRARYGHGPLYVSGVIDVGGTANRPGVPTETVVAGVAWTPGGSFTIDGRTISFTNAQGVALTSINLDGRLFVPMRAIIEGMGGSIEFFAGVNGGPHRLVTTLPGAAREEAIWTVGLAEVNAGGVHRPLTSAPMIVNAPGTPNDGSTFLPLRGIAEAHGLVLSEGTTANPVATISLVP
jgi:hypothetical protein